MGIKNTKYDVLPPSYEASISNNKHNLPTYDEIYQHKYEKIDYNLKENMIKYIIDNNIYNLCVVDFIDENLAYICKKKNINDLNNLNNNYYTHFIDCNDISIKFKDYKLNQVYLINIRREDSNRYYYAIIFKQTYLNENKKLKF